MLQYEGISFLDFQKAYDTEEKCREKLFKMKWPNGFVCPHCGNTTYSYHTTRHLYQCKKCAHQTSVTAGTIMHRTRTPLVKWFWIIYLLSNDKRGMSTLELSRRFSMRYATVWAIAHKIRTAMKERDNNYKLEGIIEIDETFIGSSSTGKSKKGRGTDKANVIVSVATTGESMLYAKMHVVESVNTTAIKEILTDTVPDGATIKTDGLQVYSRLSKETRYQHERIVISRSEKKAHELLKWVHIIAGNAKAWINGTFHGINKKHLQLYLGEFCYRLNRRKFSNQLFDRLLNACLLSRGRTYADLVG